jgi:hypothetical protein
MEHRQTICNSVVSLRIGRVGVEPTYEHLIRVSDATGLPSAPYCATTNYYTLHEVQRQEPLWLFE